MQDVTDLPFWKVLSTYGGPDVYYTEYFRVHRDSRPEKDILRSIDENPTGRPVIAQMIGQDIPSLVRTAAALQQHPILGVDLNLGCPAPIVCSKNAGGGLLKNPGQIDEILSALRPAISLNFTVKTRLGFADPAEFDRLLEIFESHPLDTLTIHARTVKELYRPVVHYEKIAQAVPRLRCPVLANGNVGCTASARHVLEQTGAAGLMIGRGAIRHPWIFNQIREAFAGEILTRPTRLDLRAYIDHLSRETRRSDGTDSGHLGKMKKYLNYICWDRSADDIFLKEMRLCQTLGELEHICDRHLHTQEPLDLVSPFVKELSPVAAGSLSRSSAATADDRPTLVSIFQS
jgi:tRNA-dihydrouridine synthase